MLLRRRSASIPKTVSTLSPRSGRDAALLHSQDGGKTFAAWSIPGRERDSRSFDLEQFSGHNGSDGPPPFIRVTRTASDPKRIWRRINDLELFVPRLEGDSLVIGEPILLTKSCIGLAMHSGAPSSIVSRGSKIHVAWAEANRSRRESARRTNLRGHLRPGDQNARWAGLDRLRCSTQRHPQHPQHYHGQPRLSACAGRHARATVPIRPFPQTE